MKGFLSWILLSPTPTTSKQHCGWCVSASLQCSLHYADLKTSGSVQTAEKLRQKSDAENELQFVRQQRVGYFLGTSQMGDLSSPVHLVGLLIYTYHK